LEDWKIGRLEDWKIRILEDWNLGIFYWVLEGKNIK
jgi:hypothetical protein